MKVAIFSVSKGYSNQGYNAIPTVEYSFYSLIELEDVNISSLLADNTSILIGNKLYIKVPDEINQVNHTLDIKELLEGDNVIFLDEFTLLYSMVATVSPVVKGIYKIEGEPLFKPGIIHSTAGFKKLYGKNFSVFKLV